MVFGTAEHRRSRRAPRDLRAAMQPVLALAIAVLGLLVALPAQAQLLERWPGRWVQIGSATFDPGATGVSIDVSQAPGAYKAVRLHAIGGPLEISRVVVAYADRAFTQRTKPLKIAPNGRSWPLDLRRQHKFVDMVQLTLAPTTAGAQPVRIEVWGLQDKHGATARRPAGAAVAAVPEPAPADKTVDEGKRGGGAAETPAPPPEEAPVTRGMKSAKQPPEPPRPEEAQPAWQLVPVFFGTDRAPDGRAKRLGYTFERARRLELGRALITVPRAHTVPQIERPWVLQVPYFQYKVYEEAEDPTKHFIIREIARLSREEVLQLVRERLVQSKEFRDHALVFIHGFNTSFDNALYRTAQLAYDLKFDGVPFAYSWPSKGALGVQDYNYDRESAGQSEPHLKSFLEMVVNESGAKHVSIIAHSMGNQALFPALRDIRRALPQGVALDQLVLAAPDIDRDNFEFLARQIEGVSRGVTLYAASNDRAMEASRRYAGGVPRAGDVPATGPVVVPGIDTIDVTATSTAMLALNHSGFAEKTELLNDLKLLILTGQRPPDKRMPDLERVGTERGEYWRYQKPR